MYCRIVERKETVTLPSRPPSSRPPSARPSQATGSGAIPCCRNLAFLLAIRVSPADVGWLVLQQGFPCRLGLPCLLPTPTAAPTQPRSSRTAVVDVAIYWTGCTAAWGRAARLLPVLRLARDHPQHHPSHPPRHSHSAMARQSWQAGNQAVPDGEAAPGTAVAAPEPPQAAACLIPDPTTSWTATVTSWERRWQAHRHLT